jgi:sulfane dehydrogenase subunit SoxC
VITRPSYGMKLAGPGFCEISGIAWSGAGRIRRVEVSLDGGATWKEAAIQGPVLSKSLVRFRLPWDWNGAPAIVASRAVDEKGNAQPSRAAWLTEYGQPARYHNHSIQAWEIAADGSIANAFM